MRFIRMPLRVVLALAVVAVAVAGLGWTVAGSGPRRAVGADREAVETVGVVATGWTGRSRRGILARAPVAEPHRRDGRTDRGARSEARGSRVRVTLFVRYANGVRPRRILLVPPHGKGWAGGNDDRSGVFRLELPRGTHGVKWLHDALGAHRGDPLPLGIPRWTIDTGAPRTWEWTVPVAAQMIVHQPKRGLPELWRNGKRVPLAWEEWGSSRGGPTYLRTHSYSLDYRPPQTVLVAPGIYTMFRRTGAQRWSQTLVLNALQPYELDREGDATGLKGP